MESLKTVTGLLNSVLKASEAAHAATEALSSSEEQLVRFFNAMHQEVTELVKQAEENKARIAELESQIETYKARIAELESEISSKDTVSKSVSKTPSKKGKQINNDGK